MSAIESNEAYRASIAARHQADHARLRRSAEALIRANRTVLEQGENEVVSDLALELGFERHDFVCFDVRVRTRRATLVCVPSRLWHRQGAMAVFFDLKADASLLGHQVVLVPESFIRRQPRIDTAHVLMGAVDMEVSAGDRMSILEFLLENGGGALSDVASLVRHNDPVGAVLHLVTVGALDIDLNASIAPASEVRIAAMVA